MNVRRLKLPEIVEITPPKFGDDRGYFAETFNRQRWREFGIDIEWVQDNHSLSAVPMTLRGLHFQEAPYAQHKLIRVLKGAILDVAVDIRAGSPTYREWVSVTISASAFNQLLVPEGFAHGFLTLEPDTEVSYKVSAAYSREHDRSIRWDDPAIGIDWGLERLPILSAKDQIAPTLAEANPGFRYDASRGDL